MSCSYQHENSLDAGMGLKSEYINKLFQILINYVEINHLYNYIFCKEYFIPNVTFSLFICIYF